jgi:predicted transcriptional regulator
MKLKDTKKCSFDLSPSEELELFKDVQRGLADIEAGRVVPHEEARARLLLRYEKL